MKKLLLLASLVMMSAFSVASTTMTQNRAGGVQSASTGTPAATAAVDRMPANGQAWTYNFSDFADGALPGTDWNFEEGTKVSNYNGEDQAYTARTGNVRIENGVLVIEAKPESMYGKKYTSARINTLDKFDFDYGTIEAEMMLPAGAGTWPAAWLMPSVDKFYDPRDFGIDPLDKYAWAVNGEIDFAEAIGRTPGVNIPAAHTYNSRKSGAVTYTPGSVPNAYSQYHRYGVTKTPNSITFTIDGVPYASRVRTGDSVLDWPFNQRYYLILNLAIGGSWAGAAGIDDASAPWQLKIKSLSYRPL
jgi:beta-glucanase (GH16 family)